MNHGDFMAWSTIRKSLLLFNTFVTYANVSAEHDASYLTVRRLDSGLPVRLA